MRSSRPAGRLGCACSLLAALVTLASSAHAQDARIEEARNAVYQADFDRARDIFTEVLASPTLDRAGAIEAHRYLAGLERSRDGAFRHALAAAALDPDVAPPEGMSSVRRLLDEARETLGGAALAVELRLEPDESGERSVIATVVPPVSGVVDELRLDCEAAGSATQPLADGAEARVTVGSRPFVCRASATTAAGAVLASGELREDPVALPAEPVPEPAPSEGGSMWPWAAYWGGAAVLAVVIIAVAVAVGSSGSSSDMVELAPVTVEPWR